MMTALEGILLSVIAAIVAAAATWYFRPRPAKVAPMAFVRQWRPLTPAEIAAAFAGWNETDARWRAQWDLLSNELEGALGDITQTKATAEELARWAGRVEMIVHWRAQLLALRKGAENRAA